MPKRLIQNKSRSTILLPIIGSLVVLIASLFFLNIYISDNIEEFAEENIKRLVNNSAKSFELRLESDINMLESSAALLPVWDYLRYINFDSEQYNFLKRTFDYMAVINPYGYGVGSDTKVKDFAKEDYFQRALKGETVVSNPIYSELTDKLSIIIATPMIAHGETRGVLAGFIFLESLDKIFGNSIAGLTANMIVDSKGTIISNGVESSILTHLSSVFDKISQNNIHNTDEFTVFKEEISNNISGQRVIDFSNEEHFVYYEPIGIKDWMIMSIIPQQAVQSAVDAIVIVTALVSLLALLIVSVFAIIINSSQRRMLEKVAEIAYVSQTTLLNTLVKFKLDSESFLEKNSGKNFLLVKFDVENFRLINEALSTKEGDRVLRCMAAAIGCDGANACLCAHIHADEFLIMLAYNTEDEVSDWRTKYSEKLLSVLGNDFNYKIRIIAGYYYLKAHTNIDISTALERVNIAHRYAKGTKALVSVYSDEFLTNAIRKKEIENRMEIALQQNEFIMFLQPELELNTGRLIAAEALVRWQYEGKIVPPDEFIPLFEQNNFIIKLDMYMFEKACEYLKNWQEEGRELFAISVNFSRNHLYSKEFLTSLVKICKKYSIEPRYLGIEITESSMLKNESELISLVKQLQNQGFRVLMDDFGAGYSSLGLLKSTPVDVLKLDKSFFTKIESLERSIAVVNSVIQLSKNLNIRTVAEGVETLENAKILKEMGCDIIQGYYYAKPMKQEDFKTFYDSEESIKVIE